MSDTEELSEVRRLLRETMDRCKQLEMELALSQRQSGDLTVALAKLAEDSEFARKAASDRILHVFGCAGCQGEHRSIWTQELTPPFRDDSGTMCERAYVCPRERTVVLVSYDSEETFNG